VSVATDALFTPVRTRRSFEEALEQIAECIKTGDLGVGDRLPSERDIAGAMGISRPTLREALRILIDAGIVEVRSRSGGMVVRSDLIPPTVIADRQQLVMADVGSVLEVRRVLECNIARIAAVEAVEDDFDALEETIALQCAADADDVVRHLQLDERFHLTLARATGNPMFSEMMRTILRRIAIARDMTPRSGGDKELEVEIHRRTLDALRSRDLERVDEAMEEHMSYLEVVWERETGHTVARRRVAAISGRSTLV
jgi:GntR family transcriptional regulator, transcriptional repressor for pyruvate dehydrogenase complex